MGPNSQPTILKADLMSRGCPEGMSVCLRPPDFVATTLIDRPKQVGVVAILGADDPRRLNLHERNLIHELGHLVL